MKTKLAITIVLLLFVLVFVVQNTATVEIRLLFWEAAIPRSLLILMTLLFGIVVGWSMRAMYRISKNN